MSAKKYKIGIYTLGKTFLVKGKVTRSPFEAIVNEKDLAGFKLKIKTDGIDNYSIEEFLPTVLPNPVVEEIKPVNVVKKSKAGRKPKIENSEIKIEELESKSKSLLEKYSNGELWKVL